MAVFILLPLFWGILIGLIFSHLVFYPILAVAIIFGSGLILVSISILFRRVQLLRIGILVCGCCLGTMIWHNVQVNNEYDNVFGATIDMQGRVMMEPSITSSGNQAVVVLPDGFSQSLRVSLFHHAYLKRGDRVWIRGQVKQPENFDNFNYVNYLKQQNVYGELIKAQVIVIEPSFASVSGNLYQLRRLLINRTEFVFTEQAAAIILGMLIGDKKQLSSQLYQSFQKVGLVHILVVSGFNLTIIAMSVGGLARIIGRRPADFLSLGVIWLFVLLVGASSAVIRAGIMASLLISARLFGRLAFASVSLLFAIVVMVVINPWRLFYDIGFQLSVAATYGVLEANQLRINFEKDGWLSEIIWSSFGAIIFTAPIVAYYFGTFSVVALLANLLVLPATPYLMLFGFLGLFPNLTLVFVPVTELLISVQLNLIQWLANLSFSQIEIKPDFAMIVSYYVLTLVMVSAVKYHERTRLKDSTSHAKITKITI